MKSDPSITLKDWFALSLRIFGVYKLLVTIDSVVTVFNYAAHLYPSERTSTNVLITHLLANFLIAAWLLKAAPGIASFFYPDPPPQPPLAGSEPLAPGSTAAP